MTPSSSSKIKVQPAGWFDYQDELTKIRTKVFIEEQDCPPEDEWDEHDRSSRHFIAYEGSTVLGCGRLMKSGQIGRMAVYKHARGRGVGGAILSTITRYCEANGIDKPMLNAQTHAIDFYRQYGFEPYGEVFMEVGIPHQPMRFIQ